MDDASIGPPSLRTFLCLPVFLIASGIQRDCHYYLASLEKYTLPTHPAFQSIVCPHYMAECAIYTSLAIIAAPPGEVVNKTILAGLVFVVINLGVSAQISKDWYEGKFGRESMQNKWRMIPFIY
jgi:3-oxo-5-alpha-steroid 4-dehydrogenase 3 / polyprenol reductase